jgi:hypothetical protein
MKKISYLTLVFSILSLVFFILLVFLRIPFPPYPLMSYQDIFDIFTPLVLIPIYWALFKYPGESTPAEETVFMVLGAFWVSGQGMHLAANSINNLIGAVADSGVLDVTGSDVYSLTYFYDEILSHYLWHIGVVGLAILLIYREWLKPTSQKTAWWLILIGGMLYGFTLFSIFLEGQTIALGIPFVYLFVLFTLIWGRKKLNSQPILAFLFISCLVAALFFTGWGLYWGGFPQFSEVGLI